MIQWWTPRGVVLTTTARSPLVVGIINRQIEATGTPEKGRHRWLGGVFFSGP
jgi:hypothetical protein